MQSASSRESTDDSHRVLRNTVSFGAFLFSPLQMACLSRALGAEGFGRWWWTFVLLEAAGLLGMQSTDLYVRRELPRHAGLRDPRASHQVVGSALAVSGGIGLMLCLAQVVGARALARTQGDPALALYISMLAGQPVLVNLTAVLAAALQSVNAYGAIALLRGVVGPLAQVIFLASAWWLNMGVAGVLFGLMCCTILVFVAAAFIYARHFELRLTVASVRAPSEARRALAFGLPLAVPNALWTVGGKVELYLLQAYVSPATLGVYAACLQLVSVLPNVRMVFDPIAQTQIAALQTDALRPLLGASLQRLSRWCALALLPLFLGLVTLGEPVLMLLLGRPAPGAALNLVILAVGQLLGTIALASWLAPMLLPARAISLLAATTLLTKTALVLTLAPHLGAVAAAIATALGTVLAQQGMALMGGRMLGVQVYSRRVLLVSAATLVGGVLAAWLQRVLHLALNPYIAGSVAAGTFSLLALAALLEADERGRIWAYLRQYA